MGDTMQYYTYILLCSDNSLYTGYTDNLKRRIAAHNCGNGAKYTRARLPVELVYWEKYTTKQQAMQREYAIKQFTRAQKLRLLPEEVQERMQQNEHVTKKHITKIETRR